MGYTVTTHNRRIHAIVAAAAVPTVEAAVVQILGADYAGCLSVPLSATGQSPATYYAASAQVTEAERAAILALLNPAAGVHAWRGLAIAVDSPEDPCVVTDSTNLPDCPSSDMRWTFEACLQSLGLQKIQSGSP